MNNTMRICSWNCKGIRSRREDLRILIEETKPSVIMLQETHLPDNCPLNIPGYKIYRNNPHRGSWKGGLAILVSKLLPSQEVKITTHLQAMACRVGSSYPITVCNVYLSNEENITALQLKTILQQLPGPQVIAGDFNAHNLMWGSSKTDNRGKIIETFTDEENLFMYNEKQSTYLDSRTGKYDALDLFLSSNQVVRIAEFKVAHYLYGSDHFPVYLTISPKEPQTHQPHPRWSFKKANWELFKETVSQYQFCNKEIDINEMLNSITSSILNSAKAAIPRFIIGEGRPKVPWWTSSCRRALRDRRKAWWRFYKNPTTENLELFKKARTQSKKTFLEAKKESWRRYISSINEHTKSTEIWRNVKQLWGKRPSLETPVLKKATDILTDPKKVSDLLAQHFAAVSATASYPKKFQKLKEAAENEYINFESDNNEYYNTRFSLWELETALSTLKNSSPGPDQIHNIMLKNLPKSFHKHLLNLFNAVWEKNEYPESWREAILIPIAKPGKDPSQEGSYRPIAMTSALGKLLEKMVNSRLMWVLETRNLLSSRQVGFRKNQSTHDHLVALDTYVKNGFARGQVTLGVFFDCEKAYDRTWKHQILKQLKNFGFKGNMAKYVQNFLSKRTFRVRVGDNFSDPHEQQNGVPQGAVLSVTLFLLAVHSAAKEMPSCVETLYFVDDFTVLFRSKKIQDATKVLQRCINTLNKWATNTGLSFSPSKTNAIIFSKRKRKEVPKLDLAGQQIPIVNKVKYLGLLLDEKLNWKHHIENLKARCYRDLKLLTIIKAQKWGADRKTLLRLYRQTIRSKLDYGAIVYSSAKEPILRRLDSVHNSGIRIATGAFKTSPVASLLVETNEQPLHLRRHYLVLKYAFRKSQFPKHYVTNKIFSSVNRSQFERKPSLSKPLGERFRILKQLYQLDNLPSPCTAIYHQVTRISPWLHIRPQQLHSYKSKNQTSEITHTYNKIIHKYKHAELIYTDGSKDKEQTGYAYTTSSGGKGQFKGCPLSSITNIELDAIKKAVMYAIENDKRVAIVFTDSSSALFLLRKLNVQHNTVIEIRELIAKHQMKIKFCWIPGHAGIKGNEEADKLAKSSLQNGVESTSLITINDLDNVLRRRINREWQVLWDNTDNNKLKIIKPVVQEWKTCYRESRHEETVLCRLRLGHTRLTHSYLFTRDREYPKCRLCNEFMTVKHILIDCFRLQDSLKFHQIPATMADILGDEEHTIQNLFKFLLDNDIINEI